MYIHGIYQQYHNVLGICCILPGRYHLLDRWSGNDQSSIMIQVDCHVESDPVKTQTQIHADLFFYSQGLSTLSCFFIGHIPGLQLPLPVVSGIYQIYTWFIPSILQPGIYMVYSWYIVYTWYVQSRYIIMGLISQVYTARLCSEKMVCSNFVLYQHISPIAMIHTLHVSSLSIVYQNNQMSMWVKCVVSNSVGQDEVGSCICVLLWGSSYSWYIPSLYHIYAMYTLTLIFRYTDYSLYIYA